MFLASCRLCKNNKNQKIFMKPNSNTAIKIGYCTSSIRLTIKLEDRCSMLPQSIGITKQCQVPKRFLLVLASSLNVLLRLTNQSQAFMNFLSSNLRAIKTLPCNQGVEPLNFSGSGSVWVQQRFQISVQFRLRFR